ncbi:MAG: isochorismate synthase MenF [Cyanobacteriota bacterium]
MSPIRPAPVARLAEARRLYGILRRERERLAPGERRLVSWVYELPSLDPLTVLERLAPHPKVHFYGEDPLGGERILGYGELESYGLTPAGPERFLGSRRFLETCWRELTHLKETGHQDGLGPQIFGGFSFFPETAGTSAFPPAFWFLPRYQLRQDHRGSFLRCTLVLTTAADLEETTEQILAHLEFLRCLGAQTAESSSAPSPDLRCLTLPQGHFAQTVAEILEQINQGGLEKLVLAQSLDVSLPPHFSLSACLRRLRCHYPDCYLFSLGNPQGHSFVGASPERLLSVRQGQLTIDALAGSAPRGNTPAADRALAQALRESAKEQREHQTVLGAILRQLEEQGLAPQCRPQQVLQLSNIQHLWTEIQAPLPADLHPLDLAALLHPTPAVAGVPRERACELIRRYETFDRGLYASPLGWLDAQGNCELRVGIRSALITGSRARLYAGAGIVRGSDPHQEQKEIELKLRALGQALLS